MSNSVCGVVCPVPQGKHRSAGGPPAHFSVACVLCPAAVWGVHPETSGWARLRVMGRAGWGGTAGTFCNVNSSGTSLMAEYQWCDWQGAKCFSCFSFTVAHFLNQEAGRTTYLRHTARTWHTWGYWTPELVSTRHPWGEAFQ